MTAPRGQVGRRTAGLPSRVFGVVAVVLALSSGAPPGFAAETGSLLADLPPGELSGIEAGLAEVAGPRELLERILRLDDVYQFDAGVVVVYTDRRWFSTPSAGGRGAPILEVRRWPGDTLLALYALAGAGPGAGQAPPVPGAVLDGPESIAADEWLWEGELDTGSGSRRCLWVERAVPEAPVHLGALLVPGDAGLGSGSVDDRRLELLAVLDLTEVRYDAWRQVPPDPVGETIVVPSLGVVPGERDERDDPWQIVRGADFTLGLPPGFRARRLYVGYGGPRPIAGGLLWFRGRYTDSEGENVVVGDHWRAGYLAEAPPQDPAWVSGERPPVGAPSAVRRASQPFALAAEWTRATQARAERWAEPGFDGEWLVFRMVFPTRRVEVALPVLSGRRSQSLFWIPLTLREADEPPAPPPIDPAQRFGIGFSRLLRVDRERNPWIEGYLDVPGLRLELPVGWWPVAQLRSRDGFPVRLLDGQRKTVGRLVRLEPGNPQIQEAAVPGDSGWAPVKRPKQFHAAAVYDREDGSRLYVAREGHAFLLEPDSETTCDSALWQRLLDGAYLLKPRQ